MSKFVTAGDMMIERAPPLTLYKALAFLGARLHPVMEASGKFKPGISKESCVLCSLIVRDFLKRIGYPDAVVAPCFVFMIAKRGEETLHSLGIGKPDDTDLPTRWSGHMVVTIPSTGYLIDLTLYQANRPQWSPLPGMLAMRLLKEDAEVWTFKVMAEMTAFDAEDKEYRFDMLWLSTPANDRWRFGPDFERRLVREGIVKELVRQFRASK